MPGGCHRKTWRSSPSGAASKAVRIWFCKEYLTRTSSLFGTIGPWERTMSAEKSLSTRLEKSVVLFLINFIPAVSMLSSQADGEDSSCPLGLFPCGNLSVCLPQRMHCNGPKDCPNGADEHRCGDNVGWAVLFAKIFPSPNTLDDSNETDCFLLEYPESCDCTQTKVWCVDINLEEVPQLSHNITWLDTDLELTDESGDDDEDHASCSNQLHPDMIWETQRDMAAFFQDQKDLLILIIRRV